MKISYIRNTAALSNNVRARIFFHDRRGFSHRVDEWSMEAIHRPDTLEAKDASGDIEIPFQGFAVSFPARLRKRANPDLLYFSELDNRQTEVLREFYGALQAGQMSGVGDVIQAIDVPLDQGAMILDKEDQIVEGKVPRRWGRTIRSVATYLVLAALVFGSLGFTLWSGANYVETVDAKVVAAEDGTLAVHAWVPEDLVTRTWIGMPAEIHTNIEGVEREIAARVEALTDPSEGDQRYQVTMSIVDASTVPGEFAAGRPVDVKLDRNVLAPARPWFERVENWF